MSLKYFLIALVVALSMCHHFDQQCPANSSGCMTENGVGCCKFKDAVCCPSMNACCPKGYTCTANGCEKPESNEIVEMGELNKWTLADLKKLNWQAILKCLSDASTIGPDVIELIRAIKKKDYAQCAKIAFDLLGKGSRIVEKCIGYFKNEDNGVANAFDFDWEGLVQCIMSTAPLVDDIIELVKVIKAKDYHKAITLVYKLIQKGSVIVKECIRVIILHHNSFRFDWEAFVKCIQSAAPLVKEIAELIEVIKSGDYAKAIQLIYKLIESGSAVVKECMKVIIFNENRIHKFKFDWEAFLRCIQATAPMAEEIIELINAIKSGDYAKALQLVQKLIATGSTVVKECMKVVLKSNKKYKNFLPLISNGFDWEAFLKCIEAAGPIAEDVKALVAAIKRKDFITAFALAYKLIASGNEVIQQCMKVVTRTKNFIKAHYLGSLFLKFDWEAFLRCIQATAPMAEEIIELINAIKSGDYAKAIQLIYKLIATGSDVVKECMKVMTESRNDDEELIEAVFSNGFDWEAFVKCIMSTEPLVEEVIELIAAIKAKDYVGAIKKIYDLIATGSVVVKECMKVMLRENNIEPNKWFKKAVRKVKGVLKKVGKVARKVHDVIQKGQEIYSKGKDIYEKGKDIYQKGKSIYEQGKVLFGKNELELEDEENFIKIKFNIDWQKVLECILAAKPVAKDVLELVRLIKAKKYPEAFALGYKIIKDGSALIKRCFHKSSKNDISVNIDWKALARCLVDHLPELTKDVDIVIELISAIKNKDWASALKLVYQLFQDGKAIIKICLAPKRKNLIKLPKIDWDLLLECIKEAGPVAKDVVELVKAIKAKNYEKAFQLLPQILMNGNQLIKKCVKIAKKKN